MPRVPARRPVAQPRLRLLISAGPTREPIDPVRFLSNASTGAMGAALAGEAIRRRHRVTVVSGPITERLPAGARVLQVQDARQMARALRREAPRADAIIMAAAVADFRPVRVSPVKLKRRSRLTLVLEATPEIIGRLPRRPGQVVAGFALEPPPVVRRAVRKLREKRLDLVLAQQVGGGELPFGRTRVRAWLVGPRGEVGDLGRLSKPAVARVFLDTIERLWVARALGIPSEPLACGGVAKW